MGTMIPSPATGASPEITHTFGVSSEQNGTEVATKLQQKSTELKLRILLCWRRPLFWLSTQELNSGAHRPRWIR